MADMRNWTNLPLIGRRAGAALRGLLFPRPVFAAAAVLVLVAGTAVSQSVSKAPKTIFRNSDGKLITNNEFVDIRIANPSYRDATIVKTLDDGTVEFRLQKVPQEGMAARAFSVNSIDGRRLALDELKGKVVVLNFWFIGCPACMSEIPRLNALKEKFASDHDAVFVAMTADDEHLVKRFLSDKPFRYAVVANAGPVLDSFGFSGYPKNIVIDKQGKIVYWRSVVHAWDKFESVIAAELER